MLSLTQVISIITINILNMTNDVQLSIIRSKIPVKYVGDTDVQSLPCTVDDMIDQGVMICDGRFSDEACWEGEGIIISPTIPHGTKKVYRLTDLDLGPADPNYAGALVVDFSAGQQEKSARILVYKAPDIGQQISKRAPKKHGGRAGNR